MRLKFSLKVGYNQFDFEGTKDELDSVLKNESKIKSLVPVVKGNKKAKTKNEYN